MRHNRSAASIKLAIFFLVIACVSPALAHTIKLFATVENETISGYGYFPGGGKYRKGKIAVYGPEKVVLGQTMTDDNGAFSFKAQYNCDHVFTIETSDGHLAQYTIKAGELPESLPKLHVNKSAGRSNQTAHATLRLEAPDDAPEGASLESFENSTDITAANLEEIISRTIARQVRPLREQLEQYEQKVRLHDILGGIGYIFGITGIAFYFLSRKKYRREK